MEHTLAGLVPEFVILDAFAEERVGDRNGAKDQEHPGENAEHRAPGFGAVQPGQPGGKKLHERAKAGGRCYASPCFARRRGRFAAVALRRRPRQITADRPVVVAVRLGETARHADAADPGEIGGDRENVRQIHLQRIGLSSPILNAGSGEVGERSASTSGNAWKSRRISVPHFLRAQVIGVVVAAAQHVGAENDAPFHFRAETFLAGPAVMIEQVLRLLARDAVTHAVEARQIGRASAVAMM